jgi:hypothetical protein
MIQIKEIGLEIHDVINGNLAYLDELIALYLKLFPKYARYVPLMIRRANRLSESASLFVEHQWLTLVHGEPAALVVFKYNHKRNCGLGLDLGVHPDFRMITYNSYSRLSSLLIHLRHQQLIADAKALCAPIPLGCLVEVESPNLVAQFIKYGMNLLPVTYFEPPAPADSVDLINSQEIQNTGFAQMHLGIYPVDKEKLDIGDPMQISEFIKAFLVDHYCLEETHWAVSKSLQSIPKRSV